jgi:3-phenylpropionate/cinnamic acid dioxygenase small subunit
VSSDDFARIALQHEIERFLVLEADLLDRREFEAWLDLLDEEVRYVLPVRAVTPTEAHAPAGDPRHANTFVDETKETLERRVRRMALPNAWSEQPPARTCRFVSNVRIAPSPTDVLEVTSSLMVYRSRLAQDGLLFVGARHDRLRRSSHAPGWRLLRREVHVLDAVIMANHLGILF